MPLDPVPDSDTDPAQGVAALPAQSVACRHLGRGHQGASRQDPRVGRLPEQHREILCGKCQGEILRAGVCCSVHTIVVDKSPECSFCHVCKVKLFTTFYSEVSRS